MAEKIHSASSWTLPPTVRQLAAIDKQMRRLGIVHQSEPSNRWEARQLLYELRERKKSGKSSG